MSQAMKHNRLHKANVRASETPEQTLSRQEMDKVRKARKRASETPEQTMNRQKQSRTHMASIRFSETPEQTLNRQETDKVRKARKRASETPEQVLQPKKPDKDRVSSKQSRIMSIEHAISAVHCETKDGHDFVCTCCHYMMYRKSVVQCNKSKTNPDVVFSVDIKYISNDGKQWICRTCNRALVRGSMPLQAI